MRTPALEQTARFMMNSQVPPSESPDRKIAPAAPSQPALMAPARLAALLAALAMIGPFSVDTYLPAFPEMQRSLGATVIAVQQSLTVYMLSFAVMILWHGALSDALGRRNVILIFLAIFAVASLGCAAAHTIEYLVAFRVLQGASAGAGVVVGRAMIRDAYSGPRAERLLSLVTMIFAIGPAIAPVLGGWIVTALDWRSIFLFLFAYSAILLWICWNLLPETLPAAARTPLKAKALASSYRKVLGTLRFHFYSGTIAFNFAGLFLYVAAAPTFLIEHLHLSSRQFAWQFLPSVAGIFVGALATNRLAGRIRIGAQVRFGFVLLFGAAGANLTYHLLHAPAIPWSVAPLFFYCIGMGMTAPGITLLVLDLYPDVRGVVASCQSFTQTMLAAVVAGLVSPLLAPSVVWLALGQLGFVTIALISWRLGRSRHSIPSAELAARSGFASKSAAALSAKEVK
jgi:DHA1 family bicyclomycin/chloramphenicol resistance-like MFS transporter